MPRAYDAILLDLDGTLVDASDRIHPRTLESLRAAAERGVRVLVATGRSELATAPVLDALAIDEPAIVYNGAAVWDPRSRRLVEERTLSRRSLERTIAFGLERGYMTVTMCAGAKYALEPRGELERMALRDMRGLRLVAPADLLAQRAIRVTLFSTEHASSLELAQELEQHVAQPIYLTHFPLSALPHHRESTLLVCDVHPPCRGKGEALRLVAERYQIPPARVVAVGDATNDVPMLEAAGLAIAMEHSMPEALAHADRVIGGCESDAIGKLVEELFLRE